MSETPTVDLSKMAEQTPDYDGPPGEAISDEQRAAAIEDFNKADRPDVPVIDEPRPGTLPLMHGVKIDDEWHRTATVRELNGADEEALAKLNRRAWNYNTQVQDTIVKRATVSIGEIDATTAEGKKVLGDLILGDRDLLFSETLLCTYGRTMDVEGVRCPHCDAIQDFGIDFDLLLDIGKIPEGIDPDGFDVEVLSDRNDPSSMHTYTIRYPRGRDQLIVWGGDEEKSNAQIDTEILVRVMLGIDGKPVLDAKKWALEAPKLVRRDLIAELMKQPLVRFKEVEVPCVECAVEIPTAIGWADLL